jgi:hypothetical protein
LIWPASGSSGTSIAFLGARTSFSYLEIGIDHSFLMLSGCGSNSAAHSRRDIAQQGARQAEHRDVSDGHMRSCLEQSILAGERVVDHLVYRKRGASPFNQRPGKPAQSKTHGCGGETDSPRSHGQAPIPWFQWMRSA